MKKLLIIVLAALISCAATVRADDISPEKRQEIEKMLKSTGMEKVANQIMGQMIETFKTQSPDVPAEFWTKLQQQMDVHDLISRIIPVYDKYYTLEDLKAINAFYESPAGQKVLANLPQITQECMKIGQQWGEEVGQKVAQQVQEEHGNQGGGSGGMDSTK